MRPATLHGWPSPAGLCKQWGACCRPPHLGCSNSCRNAGTLEGLGLVFILMSVGLCSVFNPTCSLVAL